MNDSANEQVSAVTVLLRYIAYFFGIALCTWLLTRLEILSPGSLRLQTFTHVDDVLGTTEYSPIEMLQPGILVICGLLYAWVAQYCPQQRPIALAFGGLSALFLVREFDYFLDRNVADNFGQTLAAVISALIIVYVWRHAKRFRIAWLRMWPSPGLTLLFAGAVIQFAFAPFVGHEPLWQAILGDDYVRIVKLGMEEFIELIAYFLWLIGSAEFLFQAKAIAVREPQPAAVRRRGGRRRDGEGRY